MSDGEFLLACLICIIFVAICLALILALLRPIWSNKQIALAASLPIPLLMWGLSVFGFVRTANTSRTDCGVDACGMANAALLFVMALGIAAFWIGRFSALLVIRRLRAPNGREPGTSDPE